MRVPTLVIQRATVDYFDKADTRLNQATRQQTALAKRIATISIAELFRLAIQIERTQERTQDKPARAVINFTLLDCRFSRPSGCELLVELRSERQAALQNIGRHCQMHIL